MLAKNLADHLVRMGVFTYNLVLSLSEPEFKNGMSVVGLDGPVF